ncbi:MAG: ATP-binding protein, partial [Candidatus Omnitrophota bacterium]
DGKVAVYAYIKIHFNELETYKANAIWVYKPDFSLVYSINSDDAPNLGKQAIPKEIIRKIFMKDRLCHFYLNTESGLIEVRGATVHPTSDPDRLTDPQGYFMAIKFWNKKNVNELAELVGGNIALSTTKQPIPPLNALAKANMIVFERPLIGWDGKVAVYAYIKIHFNELETYKTHSKQLVLIFIIALFFGMVFIGIFLATAISIPLAVISSALSSGDPKKLSGLEREVNEFGDISRMISNFFQQKNDLIKEINVRKKAEYELIAAYKKLEQTQDQLIQAEKLNALGRLASGVAHEVRNPLAIILQAVNYLEAVLSNRENNISEVLIKLKDNVARANKIITTLLDFSKASSLDLKQEDINPILESSLSLVRNQVKFEGIKIITEFESGIPKVLADKNKLVQVFINLFLNAIQATPAGGKIIIRSYQKQLLEEKRGIGGKEEDVFRIGDTAVFVEVEDTGTGISEDKKTKIFEPFFTTKGSTGGTGLGLPVSNNIINMHKGLITIESKAKEGTKITVILKIRKE